MGPDNQIEITKLTEDLAAARGFFWLVAAALLTVVLWHVPYGNYILYPFTILATWFHEMAHGMAALALGGHFKELYIFPNGSGMAQYSMVDAGRFKPALIAAAGPLGPCIAGVFFIRASRSTLASRTLLLLIAGLLLGSAFLYIRSLFGLIVIPTIGVIVGLTALTSSSSLHSFIVQFLGVQACISVYQQRGYLFTKQATIDGSVHLSDTGKLSELLFLPHWFWGGLICFISAYALYCSLKRAYS